jgi:hypothetical protein
MPSEFIVARLTADERWWFYCGTAAGEGVRWALKPDEALRLSMKAAHSVAIRLQGVVVDYEEVK